MSDLTEAEQQQVLDAARFLFEWSTRQEADFDPWSVYDEEAYLAYALHYDTWNEAGPTLWNNAIVHAIYAWNDITGKSLLIGDLHIKPIDRSWHCIIRIVIDSEDFSIIEVEDAYGMPDRLTRACLNWFLMTKLMLP
jgi:hypothetical protein